MVHLEDVNPHLPAAYDLLWIAVVAGSIVVVLILIGVIVRVLARR